MATSNDEFRHDSLQDTESIVKYLDAIKEGFLQGHLRLANGDSPIELEPSGMLNFGIRAKRKDGRLKLTMKIGWKEKVAGEEERQRPLKIESQS